MASRIDTLISKCRSWDEFVELVNSLPKSKNKEKGDLFERLTQVYLQTQPTYRSKLKNVYLLSDKTIPEQLRTKLNLPDNDEGIDLVCETYSGEYWSVQCKYKSDQSAALTYKELSTFNSLSFNACKGISLGLVAHTSTKPVKKSHLMPMVNEIGLEKWLEISDADWKQIISVCRSNTLKPPKKRSPRRHQKAAIADARKHFVTKKRKRGKLIMPCGTGKSLTAYWIAQALEAKTIVVAVPSLALVRQSLADWTAEYLAEGVTPEWLAVCSDHSVGSMGDADSTVATAYEMGIPTNPSDEELDHFLKKRSKAPKIVFTTYQSAEKLCDASRRNNKTFDLLIADEAHKTVGRKSKSFATLLFDENIKVKRRLFMTATERVYNASRDDVVSMDDPDIYGSTCHQLSFKEAIKQKIICDYKIVTIAVSDAEINALIKERAKLSVSASNKTIETDAHSLAAGIAMQKAFEKYGIKHAVTFHSSIKRADNFKSQQEDLPGNSHIAHSHISSELSAGQRAKLLKGFAKEERSLVTNARCLTEGVDIKAIDCVAFVDPKQSTVDIVQAAGRAMRQSKETGKDIGYIVLPVIMQTEALDEAALDHPSFRKTLKVVTALATQDERIIEQLRATQRKEIVSDKILCGDSDAIENISIKSLEFEREISLKIWEKVGRLSWQEFKDARTVIRGLKFKTIKEFKKYKRQGGSPDIPHNPEYVYHYTGWTNYGDFLGTFNTSKKDFVSFDVARQFAQNSSATTAKEWAALLKRKDLSNTYPASAHKTYESSGWTSWSDFLNTKNIFRGDFLSYDEAKQLIHPLNIRDVIEFRKRRQSDNRLSVIPANPSKYYKNKGWRGFGDFLGTGKEQRGRSYLQYEEAKKVVRKMQFKSFKEFQSQYQERVPKNIPFNPAREYKNRGWSDVKDFLGFSRRTKREELLYYKDAEKLVHSLQLTDYSVKKWRRSFERLGLPSQVPKNPDLHYKDSGWKGWDVWFGRDEPPNFLPFLEARNYVRSLGFKSMAEYKVWASSANRPAEVPRYPNDIYNNQGWKGGRDWLGLPDYVGYEEARQLIKPFALKTVREWQEFAVSGSRPKELPGDPLAFYKRRNEWISWPHFLGKED